MANIIIIDDELPLRTVMRRILTRIGHQVREAADGEEGIELFRRQPPDVVVTDLQMPGKGGGETIAELRAAFPAVKILAISGEVIGDMWDDPRVAGADAVLGKPSGVTELQEAVERLVG